jgi:hypothetical protein
VKAIAVDTDVARSTEVVHHRRDRRQLSRGRPELRVPALAARTLQLPASAFAESVAPTEIVGSWSSMTVKVCVAVAVRDEASVTVKVRVKEPTLREAPKSFVTEATEQLSPVTAIWMPAFATRTKHAALSAGTESVASTEIVGSWLSTTVKTASPSRYYRYRRSR